MIAEVSTHYGDLAALIIEDSRTNPENLHIRSMRAFELTENQARDLADILAEEIEQKWGENV